MQLFTCRFTILMAALLCISNGCSRCYIPRFGGVASTTNHRLVQSYEELERQPAHKVVGEVVTYRRWEQKIFHIANTADCAREVRMVVSVVTPSPGDPDRKEIVITFRKYSPRGWAEPSITLEDLYEGDKVDIAYDLEDAGGPTNIIVMLNRQTDAVNRERRRIKREAEWEKLQAEWKEKGLIQ